jgi:ATP-dependent Clp protease adapter protein ClpS
MINNFFDKIYVISCFGSLDRQQYIVKHFKYNNIKFEFKPSIDYKVFKNDAKISAQNISLIQSHRHCILEAKLNSYRRILICEDDVNFVEFVNELFSEFIEILPEDWHFMQLGNQSGKTIEKFLSREKIKDNLYKFSWGTGSHCIGINSNIYDVCINNLFSENEPIDFLYYRLFEKYNCYCPKKFLADGLSENPYRIQDNSKILFKSNLNHKY